jgi:hypothetical protein
LALPGRGARGFSLRAWGHRLEPLALLKLLLTHDHGGPGAAEPRSQGRKHGSAVGARAWWVPRRLLPPTSPAARFVRFGRAGGRWSQTERTKRTNRTHRCQARPTPANPRHPPYPNEPNDPNETNESNEPTQRRPCGPPRVIPWMRYPVLAPGGRAKQSAHPAKIPGHRNIRPPRVTTILRAVAPLAAGPNGSRSPDVGVRGAAALAPQGGQVQRLGRRQRRAALAAYARSP